MDIDKSAKSKKVKSLEHKLNELNDRLYNLSTIVELKGQIS